MRSANQRHDEASANGFAKSSELLEVAEIDARLAQLDEECSLLRVKRRRILSRIAKRARS